MYMVQPYTRFKNAFIGKHEVGVYTETIRRRGKPRTIMMRKKENVLRGIIFDSRRDYVVWVPRPRGRGCHEAVRTALGV